VDLAGVLRVEFSATKRRLRVVWLGAVDGQNGTTLQPAARWVANAQLSALLPAGWAGGEAEAEAAEAASGLPQVCLLGPPPCGRWRRPCSRSLPA
jgi:hypothetical protein